MALTTQCPYCKTSFRITENQLAQHNGSVRCGVCSQVFNGHDYLSSEDGEPLPALRQSVPVVPDFSSAKNSQEEIPSISFDIADIAPPTEHFSAASPAKHTDDDEPDLIIPESIDHEWDMHDDHALMTEEPVEEMRIEPASHDNDTEPVLVINPPKTAQNAINEESEPHLDESLVTTAAAPNFIEQGKRREKRRRVTHGFLILLSFILLLTAALQGVYFWRHQIIAAVPATEAIYTAVCKRVDCTIGLETRIDELSLESNDLQAVPDEPNTYQLSLIVRNNSTIPQTWPNIELSLNSQANTTLIRRVFTPKDYLALTQLIDAGIMNQMEQPITIKFTLPENANVSGYQVYLYYP